MSAVEEYHSETTFHGPNHAVATQGRMEKGLWLTLFTVGFIVTVAQSYLMLFNYITDSSNLMRIERESSPEKVVDVHYFKVCPAYWLDKRKVQRAVDDKKFTYKNLLFALSLIPSISDRFLEEMGEEWPEIPDMDRIWGLPKTGCDKKKQLRKKREAQRKTTALREAKGVISSCGNFSSEGGDPAAGKCRQKRFLSKIKKITAGASVDTVAKSASEMLKIAEDNEVMETIVKFPPEFMRDPNLLATAVDLMEAGAGAFDISNDLIQQGDFSGALDTILNKATGTVSDLSVKMLELANKAIDGTIQDFLKDSCEIRIRCGAKKEIKNWKAQAQSFYKSTKGKYKTLTEFFGSLGNDVNPFEAMGAKHVKYEFTKGRLCQVVNVSSENISAVSTSHTIINIKKAIRLEERVEQLRDLATDVIPYATESSYDGKSDGSHEDETINVAGGIMGSVFEEVSHFDTLLEGALTTAVLDITSMSKITRYWSCKQNPGFPRIPEDYAVARCKAACRKQHETIKGLPKGYRTITENDFGNIPLDQPLAPAGILGGPVVTLDLVGAADCALVNDCDNQHYCEEWNIDLVKDIDRKPLQFSDLVDCGIWKHRILSTFGFEIKFGQAYEVLMERRLSGADMMGIIGGLLGLYVGCSLTTVVHFTVFWVKKGVTRICKGRKAEEPEKNDGGDQKEFEGYADGF